MSLSAFQRLVIRRASTIAVPKGATLYRVVETIVDKKIPSIMGEAEEWVRNAIHTMRQCSEPNPYKHATDEQIAEVILAAVDAKRQQQLRHRVLTDYERRSNDTSKPN